MIASLKQIAGPLVFIVFAMVSIQFGATLAKPLFSVLGPFLITGFRILFAALILIFIFRPWRINLKTQFTKQQLQAIIFYGFSLGLMNLFFYISLNRIPLGLAVSLEFLGPLGLSLLYSRKKSDFLWVMCASIGVYLIMPHSGLDLSWGLNHIVDPVLNSSDAAAIDPLGVFYALLAGFFWALYIFFGKKVGENHSGLITCLGMMAATLIVIPFVVWNLLFSSGPIVSTQLLFQNIKIYLPMIFLVALLSSAIPYSLEMLALKKIPEKTFGVLMSLEPLVASLMGYFNLNEVLKPVQIVAIGLIILASLGGVFNAKN